MTKSPRRPTQRFNRSELKRSATDPARVLDKTVIAIPLLETLQGEREELAKKPNLLPRLHPIIIDLNLEFPGGRGAARNEVRRLIATLAEKRGRSLEEIISEGKSRLSQQYVFAELLGDEIAELVRADKDRIHEHEPTVERGDVRRVAPCQAIFHIWPDFEIAPLINRSISTVKADAAHNAFGALGEGIVWAVIDSGIDGSHPHFKRHENLLLGEDQDALRHRDFTVSKEQDEKPLADRYGHGTHVAAIIAGEMTQKEGTIEADVRYRDEMGQSQDKQIVIKPSISGMAPKCKLVSIKVLDDKGRDPGRETPKGRVSNIIAAIDYIQDVNGYGRRIRIHGVNMSVGYDFEPRWFACGQSPLCVEVDRLVKSGVAVVVAAGNTGYASTLVDNKPVASGMDLTINDPGNADLAITVGATHRDMPHVYGVSYFSSKGPTGDGRLKPDLVAPGEKIISADSTQRRQALNLSVNTPPVDTRADSDPGSEKCGLEHGKYREDTGTSMAAPHVSGVIAAFLSSRGEFIGRPEQVKQIFCSAATDLRRERYFQGNGLVDLMRSIQSI